MDVFPERVTLPDAQDQAQAQVASPLASLPAGTLEQKLQWLSETIRNSTLLLSEVLADLNDQAVRAQQLDQTVKLAQERAALYGQAADAVARLVRDELSEEHSRIRNELRVQRARILRDSVVVAVISFFAGAIVTLLLTFIH